MEVKLTKVQYKNMQRIEAWLKDEPFRENSRDKHPQVPDLPKSLVLEQYCPNSPRGCGAFYTPLIMVYAFWEQICDYVSIQDKAILDPCAGIGNLLDGMEGYTSQFICVELDQDAFKVGSKLFPWATWHPSDAYDYCANRRNQFDLVVMNPPFNITWAVGNGERIFNTTSKSEYLFLKAAENVLRPGGHIAIIAPYNYLDKMPRAMETWFETNLEVVARFGQLPGEFLLTNIKVHGYLLVKKGDADPVINLPNPFKGVHVPIPAVMPVVDNPWALPVPPEVYTELTKVSNPLPPSPSAAIKILRAQHLVAAAEWIKDNQMKYGTLYFHGYKIYVDSSSSSSSSL